MSNIYGPGVERNLSSKDKQYNSVIFQPGKLPVSEEYNLLTEAMEEARKDILRSDTPSGWVSNPFDSEKDYHFDPMASNMFWLGSSSSEGEEDISYALVNGWVVPVAGTMSQDLKNAIMLPPPQANQRVHFVFLEVWKAQLSPDGEVNKPAEDEVYRFGNVDYGGTNLTNQIPDPRYRKETSERVQLQYRIRVISNVNPDTHPFGFNPSLRARGPLEAPISTTDPDFQFQNMGEELGDPGLWRAGVPNEVSEDGMTLNAVSPLNTVDGFVYALPICMVFRRSTDLWSPTNTGGAYNRNPDAVSSDDAIMLPTVSLVDDITKDDLTFDVDVSRAETTFPQEDGRIRIGNEIIQYQTWVGSTLTIESESDRGFAGSHATNHEEGSTLSHVTGNPLGLFSDQIVSDDVHDLRHVVSPNSFSYEALLKHNFFKLAKGELKTQWKSGEGSTKGTRHMQIDFFSDTTQTPLSGLTGDNPDNFRKVFSDAAALQPQNLLVASDGTTISTDDYTFNIEQSSVYRNESTTNWETGDNIRIPLASLRETFKTTNDKKVRFVHPLEYQESDHEPVRTWFGDQSIDDLVEGVGSDLGQMVVLGTKPSDLASSFIDGTNSTITYDPADPFIQVEDSSSNPVDFGDSGPSGYATVADYLADIEAYIILEPGNQGDVTPYKGAFKILGSDSSGQGLELELLNEDSPNFGDESYTGDWHIRLRECHEDDEELYMVLGIPEGETSPSEFVSQKNLFMTFDVLYHPNQGMGRVPEVPLFTRMERDSGIPYVRPSTFPNLASSSLDRSGGPRDYSVTPMEYYPGPRSETRVRNNQDVQTSVEDTWSEAYVDRGSKTVLFQPMRRSTISVNNEALTSNPSYSGSPGTDFGFRLANNDPCYFVPSQVLPPTGRIDIPFQPYALSTEDTAYGLNAFFTAVDGEGNAYNEDIVNNRVLGIYDPQELAPGDYNTFQDSTDLDINESAMVCRLYDEGGVRGIELPPHFGISRLMGAYLVDDYDQSQFTSVSNYTIRRTAFNGTDILRKDAEGRSLIITDDNTFVVPEQVLDIDLMGTDLSQARIVLEMSAFMFNDWKANRVQIHTLSGSSGDNLDISLLMNGPCDSTDTFMTVSTRVPYQGNLTGSMGPGFMDYRPKRKADVPNDIALARQPLDPRDAEFRNPKRVEVLASLPFVTTLGTGRIGGSFREGGPTDIGYLSQEGFPDDVGTMREAKSRALSTDQKPRIRPSLLTGMTERLPTGLLASDHLFMGESFFGAQKAFWLEGQTDLEGFHNENRGGQVLDKPFHEGTLILSDGTNGGSASSMDYQASGNLFRTYRGGTLTSGSGSQKGGSFVISGPRLYKEFPFLRSFDVEYSKAVSEQAQGGSVDEFDAEVQRLQAKYQKMLQVHGAALFGVAMLVRTQKEEVDGTTFSWGSELQMVVATGASFGVDATLDQLSGDTREILDLMVQLHPTGFGEGFCASDKFRVGGRPLQKASKAQALDEEDFDLYRGSDPVDDPDPLC